MAQKPTKQQQQQHEEVLICASCPEIHQEEMNNICKKLHITKAYAKKGDTLDLLSGNNWIPKWESKVVATVVTKAQTLNATKVKIICISGGRHCDQEMARQPSLIRAIKQEMTDAGYSSLQVKVEWLEFQHFVEEYDQPSHRPSNQQKPSNEGGKKNAQPASTKINTPPAKGETSTSFTCPSCDREFTSEHGLEQHIEATGHSWKCDVCEREFSSSNALDQHCQSTGHRKISNKTKSQSSESKGESKKGKESITTSTSFTCPSCDREFTSEHGLEQHIEATGHSWKCDVCEREFSSSNALDQHCQSTGHRKISNKTKRQSSQINSGSGKKESQGEEVKSRRTKNCVCVTCDREFNSKESLTQHIEATGHQNPDKPVRGTCYCGLQIPSFQAFQIHLRNNTVCSTMITYFQSTSYDVVAKGRIPFQPSSIWGDGPPRFATADQDSITIEWDSSGTFAGIRILDHFSYRIQMIGVPDIPNYPIETDLWFQELTKGQEFKSTTVRKKNLIPNTNYFFRVLAYLNGGFSTSYSPVSEAMRVQV